MSGSECLLDTNIIIALFNGEATVVEKIDKLEIVQRSLIVVGERYYGALKSAKTQQNMQRIRFFLSLCHIFPSDEETSYWYGYSRDSLRQKGKPIPGNDIWIAATAQQHQLTLVSRDQHFRQIDNLTLVV